MGKGAHVARQDGPGYQFSLTDKAFFEDFLEFLYESPNKTLKILKDCDIIKASMTEIGMLCVYDPAEG